MRAACRLLDLNWDGVFGFPWVPDADATLRGELPADVGLPDHFECRECGRWADVVEAAAAKTDAMATINSEWRPLFTDWKQSIGPALLQRWRGVTYQEATRVLAASERRGLIRPQGRGYVAVPALCAPCYRNRADRLASAPTAPPRDAVPAHIRFRVLQRDNFRCQYCGVSARDGALLHVDHVVPYSEGGETSEDNLITACEQCNLGKSARPIIQE